MKVYIGADHRGVDVKKDLVELLNGRYEIEEIDLKGNEKDDYTDYAFNVSEKVAKDKNSLGILICGNGIGMSIAANKVKGIRCARVVNEDDAYKARNHNGANIIAIGANLDIEDLKLIVDTYLNTPAATEERHLKRINKIIKYEEGKYNEL